MMLKVFDLLRSLGWYIVHFIYQLMDALLSIINKLNAFDIISSLSNNSTFKKFYSGVMTISITLFALVIIWKIINKLLEPEEETSFRTIFTETFKCGLLILMSTFLFVQVSRFSIVLSNYTGNIFNNNTTSMSDTMLTMFISYADGYKNSSKFKEDKGIDEIVKDGSFNDEELYLSKYVTKSKIIFSDEQDYKYSINWIMALICGGFILYSLFFAGIMLGRRQIEFLFLFCISPIVFSTSVCNKQRRGAVIEQLVSLALQSAVVILIVSLSVMVMQEINKTMFFTNVFMDITTKTLLYLGCATFILTGSQVINRFIGANVSAASGREQLMSLMGYGKALSTAGNIASAGTLGAGLLATGTIMKAGKNIGGHALSTVGSALGQYGAPDPNSNTPQTTTQKIASRIGTTMYNIGQRGFDGGATSKKFSVSDSFINAGTNSINNAIKSVAPRASYNASYYRNRNKI